MAREKRPRSSLPPPFFRFPDVYVLFGIGRLAPQEWPVLQWEANRSEDQALARFRKQEQR